MNDCFITTDLFPTFFQGLDYIYTEGCVVALHVKNGNADSLYYVLTDHLGSWNKVMAGIRRRHRRHSPSVVALPAMSTTTASKSSTRMHACMTP